jgi:hypothetical protein
LFSQSVFVILVEIRFIERENMTTKTLLNEIYTLPLEKRIFLVKKALESIRKETPSKQALENAAHKFVNEYKQNKELTSFTSLDSEGFYEAG